MVLVHDISSRRGLQVYQVSLKILNGFQVIERTRFVTDRQTDRQTDRRTDGQTDGQGKTICLPTLSGGDIIYTDVICIWLYRVHKPLQLVVSHSSRYIQYLSSHNAKTKTQISCAVTVQRFCYSEQSVVLLNPNLQSSSLLLRLFIQVYVGSGQKYLAPRLIYSKHGNK